MQFKRPFYKQLSKELDSYLAKQQKRLPQKDTMRIDLHISDIHGNIESPKTKKLIGILKKRGCDIFTITNQGSASSCRELQKKRNDILIGAKFTCRVPDYDVEINVLAYGFTEIEEAELKNLQADLYAFLRQTRQKNIPVIWANPLEYGKLKNLPRIDFFDKMSLVFENFEFLSTQSSLRQSLILKQRIESLTKAEIDRLAKKFKLTLADYCREPYKKNLAAGSASVSGIFAGETGVELYVNDLQKRLKTAKRSELALEALRSGNFVPFGEAGCYEQNLLEIFCGAARKFCAINKKAAGPDFSIFFREDITYAKKAVLFITSIAISAAVKQKGSQSAANIFQKGLIDELPKISKLLQYIPLSKHGKEIRKELLNIFSLCSSRPKGFAVDAEKSFHRLSFMLMDIAFSKTAAGLNLLEGSGVWNFLSGEAMRNEKNNKSGASHAKASKSADFTQLTEMVPLPLAAAFLLTWGNAKATSLMNNTRVLLDQLSAKTASLQQPKRMLWVTDTFEDSNGIAMVLQSVLFEIRRRNLPIDIMVCSNTLKSSDHLIVVPPNAGFTIPFYQQQPFRLPNIADVHRIFLEGEYDRIITSTEGPMGMIALYLKHTYNIPAYFYLHSDWVAFGKDSLKLSRFALLRGEAISREIYSSFDAVFVLNSDQKNWLTARHMGFLDSEVFQTAHWADAGFKKVKTNREKIFGVSDHTPLLIFAGRVSEEKGVMELPVIYREVKKSYPNIRIAIIGMGPAEKMLRKELPEAIYTGWVDHDKLPEYYNAADLLILPSRFDTFGCVVLEALSCGCPVVAYDTKGPKDILEHGKSGMLASTQKQMIEQIVKYFASREQQLKMKKTATERAKKYNAAAIMNQFLKDAGM